MNPAEQARMEALEKRVEEIEEKVRILTGEPASNDFDILLQTDQTTGRFTKWLNGQFFGVSNAANGEW